MNLGLSLGLGARSLVGAGGFSPALLFAAGEQGAWYDPSDLTSMRRFSTGATAAAVGSEVGFIADKRLMGGQTFDAFVASQPELVTNGTFDSNITGWTVGANLTAVWDAGRARITRAGALTGNAAFEQVVSVVSGTWYQITWTFSGGATNSGAAGFYNGSNTAFAGLGPTVYGNGTFTRVFQATDATAQLNFWCNDGDTIFLDGVTLKAIPGNHAIQANAAQRPILRQDGALYYLDFDGTDDSLATAAINFSATDEMSVFAGVRKLSDAAQGVVAELTASTAANNGAFLLAAPDAASATFAFDSKGTVQVDAIATGQTAPLTAVLTGLADISADTASIRVNGALLDTDTGDQGTGNYANAALFIGRRASTTLPLSGRIYSLIVRGKTTSGADLTNAETYVAGKTGVTI